MKDPAGKQATVEIIDEAGTVRFSNTFELED
ncbi:hypothetical protein J2Z37_003101 [Ammoniphilus resinae]|uniref:Uncharacterized protein n=1 Tax=Ammoniphilus resinae TaxID=861532 RepID=A0ABS4GS32_9BACL|nr:hypothetical protein [Ammoniphilus resinae]